MTDPTLAYDAAEETRRQAGQNVIEILGARFDVFEARFDALEAKIVVESKALNSRLDTLSRILWALVGLLATTVFGLLYQVVTGS